MGDATHSIASKLPETGTTIFSVMSALARECGAINLSQGFPDFPSDPRLIEGVYRHMQAGHNQYAPMPGLPALRQAIAGKMARTQGVHLDPETEITVTAGATQGLISAIQALVHPGDEVLLFEPAYDLYRPAVELAGGRPVAHQLKAPDYAVDWDAVERLIGPRTRFVLVNTPHNPTGSILGRSDWQALERLAEKHALFVLSDEVYEHLIFDGEQHCGALQCTGLRDRSLAFFSFGKTFHNTGWKVGYVAGAGHLMQEVRKVHQYTVFSVHTPTQYALADYLQDEQTYLGLPALFQQKRDRFLQALRGSPFRPLPCRGTYFVTCNFRALSALPDLEFARWFTREHGIATIPVSVFNHSGLDEGVVRFCFAKTDAVLERAAAKLKTLAAV